MRKKNLDALKDPKIPSLIVGASMHWRGNMAEGQRISGTIRFSSKEDGLTFVENHDEVMRRFDELSRPDYIVRSLEIIASHAEWWRSGASTPREVAWSTFCAVSWLETRSHLEADEYNGIVWIVLKDGVVTALRVDEPDPIHVQDLPVDRAQVSSEEMRRIMNDVLGRGPRLH